MPCSETLRLSNCFTDKAGSEGKFLSSITLLKSSFKYLEIEMDKNLTGLDNHTSFYIKLVTDDSKQARYCFFSALLDKDKKIDEYRLIENPTESEFQGSIFNIQSSTYLIYCKSVENFYIKYISLKDGCWKKKSLPICSRVITVYY